MLIRLIRTMPGQTQALDSTCKRSVHAAAVALALTLAGAFMPPSALAAAAKAAPHSPAPVATPAGPPIIFSVSATPRVAHAGDAVKWDAHVSQNVIAVTARVAVYSFALYPVRYGHFGEVFSIPKDVPPIFHGKYGVTITATAANGESTSRSIALVFE